MGRAPWATHMSPATPGSVPPPATFRPPQGEMSLSSQPRRRRAQSWDREQRDGKSHRTMSPRAGKGGGGVRVPPPPSSEPPESPTNLSHSSGPTASGLPAPSQTQAQGHQGPSVSPLLGGGGNTTQAYFPPPPRCFQGTPLPPPLHPAPQISADLKDAQPGTTHDLGTVALPRVGPAVPGSRHPSGGPQSSWCHRIPGGGRGDTQEEAPGMVGGVV